MYKELILYAIGAVTFLSGIIIGYFAGQSLGWTISIIGGCMMLAADIIIAYKKHKEKREKSGKK